MSDANENGTVRVPHAEEIISNRERYAEMLKENEDIEGTYDANQMKGYDGDLATVMNAGRALQYVQEQTEKICLVAVQQDGRALQYVEEQTPEICLAAVKQYGYVLEFVKEQTPEICLAAVQKDGDALGYVKEQTPEICLAAVKQYGYALRHVENQTPEISEAAAEQIQREQQLQQMDFDSEKELKDFIAGEKEWEEEYEEKEKLWEAERLAKEKRLSSLGLKPFSEQDKETLQQFSEQEQQIMENYLAKGFLRADGEDFSKYVASTLEVPIAQFHEEFMQWNSKNSNEWSQGHQLEKYMEDFQKDIPLMENPEKQLLLFSKYMGLEGSDVELIEKMKKFNVVQENQFPYAPLSEIYHKSISNAIRTNYYTQYEKNREIETAKQPEKRKPFYQERAEKIVESVKKLYSNVSMALKQPNKIEDIVSSTNTTAQIEQAEKRKPYHQQNTEKLLESVKNGTAPFLVSANSIVENGEVSIQPLPLVRSAQIGRAFQGVNQLVAQISLKEMGSNDTTVLTYEQAKANGMYIKKGSESFAITSFDATEEYGKKSKVYHLFPASSAKSIEKSELQKMPSPPEIRSSTFYSIAHSGDSTLKNYIGAYLAAANLDVNFVTDVRTSNEIQRRFIKEIGSGSPHQQHKKLVELGKNANAQCKDILKNSFPNEPELNRREVKNQYQKQKSSGMSR